MEAFLVPAAGVDSTMVEVVLMPALVVEMSHPAVVGAGREAFAHVAEGHC